MFTKILNSDSVMRNRDTAVIPADPGNRDYQAYLEWLSLGNTPLPADPPPLPADPPPASDIDALRKAAYIAEADPLYFKAMRQEIDIQEWHDKIAEIRLRYPKEAV